MATKKIVKKCLKVIDIFNMRISNEKITKETLLWGSAPKLGVVNKRKFVLMSKTEQLAHKQEDRELFEIYLNPQSHPEKRAVEVLTILNMIN